MAMHCNRGIASKIVGHIPDPKSTEGSYGFLLLGATRGAYESQPGERGLPLLRQGRRIHLEAP